MPREHARFVQSQNAEKATHRPRVVRRLLAIAAERRGALVARAALRLAQHDARLGRVVAQERARYRRDRTRRSFAVGRTVLDVAAHGSRQPLDAALDAVLANPRLARSDRQRLRRASLDAILAGPPPATAPAAAWRAFTKARGRIAFLLGDAVLAATEHGDPRLHDAVLPHLRALLARTGDRRLFGLPSAPSQGGAVEHAQRRPETTRTP